ncbi:MAG: site-specific integrase [Desulfobulbaceae bacterium]|nr:site-specific integrase [Desulfobulbaceae bacterium]
MNMNINFYLDSKLNRKNEKRVICYLRGVVPQKTIYLNTNLLIEPKYWNDKKQSIRAGHSNSTESNKYLTLFKDRVITLVTKYQSDNDTIHPVSLKNYILEMMFKNSESKKPSVIEVFELYLIAKKNEVKSGTLVSYQTFMNQLANFEKMYESRLTFEIIDLNFFDKFCDYSLNLVNLTNNTFHKRIIQLKSFLNWATERGYNKKLEYKKFKTKTIEDSPIVLTRDELITLYDIDLKSNTKLDNVRDIFCFACFTGQRFSDIFKIRREDINGNYWQLRTQKTNDIIKLPLNEFALAILEKHKNEPKPLPVITNQKSNKFVKELFQFAGLDRKCRITTIKGGQRDDEYLPLYELVTTHTARRTFITISLEKGMVHEAIMAMSGHKDYKTFKKYVNITEKVVAFEMGRTWDKI